MWPGRMCGGGRTCVCVSPFPSLIPSHPISLSLSLPSLSLPSLSLSLSVRSHPISLRHPLCVKTAPPCPQPKRTHTHCNVFEIDRSVEIQHFQCKFRHMLVITVPTTIHICKVALPNAFHPLHIRQQPLLVPHRSSNKVNKQAITTQTQKQKTKSTNNNSRERMAKKQQQLGFPFWELCV